jgi:hypothetical protein
VREGYLDALAARTLGVAPLLRPVTPSRFEPAGGRLEVLEIVEPAADVPIVRQAASADLTSRPERLSVPADEPLLAGPEPDPPFHTTAQPEAPPESPQVELEPAADQDTTPIGIAMLARAVSAEHAEPMVAAHDDVAPRAEVPSASPVRQSTRWQTVEPSWEPKESMPAVVVHIGRIDVRAADPVPRISPVPRRAPVQAGRSLADHLLARDRELS